MAFVTFDEGAWRPRTQAPAEPYVDPFANWVEPAGNLTEWNTEAWENSGTGYEGLANYSTNNPIAQTGIDWPAVTASFNSGPQWDSSAQAYHDVGASGLYSYDGGASWEPKRPYLPPSAGVTTPIDPADPFANFDPNDAYNGGPVANRANAQFQSGLSYLGDLEGGGVYEEPGTGNRFYAGNWYDQSNNIRNENTGTWQTLDAFSQYWDTIGSDNAIHYDTAMDGKQRQALPAWMLEHENSIPYDEVPTYAAMMRTAPSLLQQAVDVGPSWQGRNKAEDFLAQSFGSIRNPETNVDARFPTGGGNVFGSGGLSGLLKSGWDNYNKYVAGPLAETGAQLTPLLNAAGSPGGFLTGEAAARLGYGERPSDSMGAGLKEFGSAVTSGNFIDAQNENLAERPMWQQLGASAAFDPLNLVGAGAVSKGLMAVDGAGALSRILRGAGAANQAIDTGMAKLVGAAFKPLGVAARPLAAEAGQIPAGLAVRAGLGAGGAAAGSFAAPDDASPHERAMYIVGGALAGAVGPEAFGRVTKGAANAYGDVLAKTHLGREQGTFAHQSWFENAPSRPLTITDADGVTRTVKSPLSLKIIKDVPPGLPLTQNIKNAFWDVVSRVYDPKFAANKLDPETYKVFKAMGDELRSVSDAVPILRQMVEAPQVDALFQYQPRTNWVLGADGAPLPALKADGTIKMNDLGAPVLGVKGNDLFRFKDQYLAAGLISPEQYAGLAKLSENLIWVRELQESMGLLPKGAVTEGYIPSGRPSFVQMEDTPVKAQGKKQLGPKPTSSYDRKYEYAGDAFEKEGLVYPTIDEAVGMHIDEALKEVIVKHYSGQLKDTITNVPISQMTVPKSLTTALAEAKKEATQIKSKLKVENAKQARNERDIRLTGKWYETNTNRVQALILQARDQTIRASERAEALADAHLLANTAIKDHLSAATAYAKVTKAIIGESEVRTVLDDMLAEGGVLRRRMADLSSQMEHVDDVVKATSDAWSSGANIADALADDLAEVQRRLDALEDADFMGNAEVAQESLQAARDAVKDARGLFADKVMDRIKRATALARKEEAVAQNARATISTAKADELTRVIENRANTLATAFDRQSETAERIIALKNELQANVDNRDAMKNAIKQTQDLAKKVGKPLRGKELKNRLPGWEPGLPVPAAWQNTLDELIPYVPKGSHGGIVAFDMINNILRAAGATADASWGGTVGLLGLADDPRIGAKALKEGWLSAFNPKREWETINKIAATNQAKGLPSLEKAVLTGHLQIAPAEVMNLALGKPGSWLNKLEETKPIQFFDALYRAPGDVTRVEQFYKTMGDMAKRGIDVNSDKAIIEAANAANVISGRATRGPLGMGGGTSGRLFFAGRFFQSQIETVLNAMLVQGVEGDVARRALLRLAGAGAALTYTVNKLNGQETTWSPVKGFEFQNPLEGQSPIGGSIDPNFMRIRMLGHDYSLFGPWDSLVKGIVGTAQDGPYQFLRSKMAPITGATADIIKGADAIGRPLDRTALKNYAPIPFSVRSVGEQALKTDFSDPASVGSLALSGAAGMLGIKSAPLTAREEYTQELEANYSGYQPVGIDGKPLAYQLPKNPLDDPLFVAQYAKAHPDEVPSASSQLGKALEKVKADYAPKFEAIDSEFINGKLNLGQWKSARASFKDEQRGATKAIIDQMNFADAQPGTPAQWVSDYYKTFEQAESEGLIPKTPAYYDRVDQLQAEWLRANGDVAQDYVDSLTLTKLPDGPEREYRAAMLKLNQDGYFDMPKFENKLSALPDSKIMDLANDVSRLTDKETGDPEFRAFSELPFKSRAFLVLDAKGFSIEEITDVANSTSTKNQAIDYKIYKFENPQTLAWLNPEQKWDTLVQR